MAAGDPLTYENLNEYMLTLVSTPRRVSSDGILAETRSALELIALARYAKSTGTIGAGFRNVTMQQASPPSEASNS